MSNLTSRLPDELAPQSLGLKYGTEYIRRLPTWIERVWPVFAVALERAGLAPTAVDKIAAELFAYAAEDRPAHHHRHTAEGRRAVVEEQLAPHLRGGLNLKLACAYVGVPLERVQAWQRADPVFAARIESYRLRGVARLHGDLLAKAAQGSDTAIVKALEYSGEPEYVQKLRVGRITDDDVLESEAFRRYLSRLHAVLCEECRARLAESEG